MTNIVLVCAMGLSTSLMVNKMKNAAKEKGIECNIVAMSSDEFENEPVDADALLIAPQISYKADEIKKNYGESIKVIDEITQMEYGLMKGNEVLERVLNELNK